MEDSEAMSSESGHRPAAASAEDAAFGVAVATLAWVLLTVLWAADPLTILVGSLASLRVTAIALGFYFGVATPMLALLALVTYRYWKARCHLRFPLPGSARPAMGPGIVTLLAVAWLA
jgi:hypothetical protein